MIFQNNFIRGKGIFKVFDEWLLAYILENPSINAKESKLIFSNQYLDDI